MQLQGVHLVASLVCQIWPGHVGLVHGSLKNSCSKLVAEAFVSSSWVLPSIANVNSKKPLQRFRYHNTKCNWSMEASYLDWK